MATTNFEASLALVLKHEGGFVDHPADPGGATNLGITRATLARARGRPVSVDEVRSLSRAEAAAIYRRHYWDAVRGDDLPPGLDHAVFDCAVNSGPGRAIRLLQHAVGVAQDGRIGPATLAALGRGDVATTIRALGRARLGFLQALPTSAVFGRGWRARVAEVEREALAMVSHAPGGPNRAPGPATPPATVARAEPTRSEAPQIQSGKGPAMDDVKSIFASRTVWANFVGLAAVGLAMIGVDTGSVDTDKLAQAAAQLVAAASFIGSTVFRLTATKRLAQ
jgi:lysozyme family protein